jgi:quercetin dioxygenase-like cupin family protein
MISRLSKVQLLSAFAAGLLATAAGAQSSAVHKTTLQDQPFPPPIYHTATVRTVVDPGGEVAPHTHPGLETAYVVEGRALLTIAGRPPRPLSPGDSFSVPAGTVHSLKNTGARPMTVISTYVVDKARPIATPAH